MVMLLFSKDDQIAVISTDRAPIIEAFETLGFKGMCRGGGFVGFAISREDTIPEDSMTRAAFSDISSMVILAALLEWLQRGAA